MQELSIDVVKVVCLFMKVIQPIHLFIREFYEQVRKDPVQDWAATLAFYFMLSIFPFLIFIFSAASLFFRLTLTRFISLYTNLHRLILPKYLLILF